MAIFRPETLRELRDRQELSVRPEKHPDIGFTIWIVVSDIDAAMDVVLGGLCQKFPNLKFISVESGFGYWPYVCEISDWYWKTSGAWKEYPDRELPSVYYRRSFYSTILSEQNCAAMLEEWQDNVMFETDFPHGASAVPGTAADLPTPRDLMIATLARQKPEVIEKILHANAAKLYHID